MSESMGYDFSSVRVHTDAEANALNEQLTANAFTTGRDIFFRRGAYSPSSTRGRELIGHELSHVVQQDRSNVGDESSGMTVRPAHDAFEREAVGQGRQIVARRVIQRDWNWQEYITKDEVSTGLEYVFGGKILENKNIDIEGLEEEAFNKEAGPTSRCRGVL